LLRFTWLLAGAFALTAAHSCALFPAFAQGPAARIVAPVDESQVVTLEGNVHPLARAEFDLGEADNATPLARIILLLQPSAAQQAALDQLTEAQQNPASPLFHRWLTPAAFDRQFGIAPQDRQQVAAWLAVHGFAVEPSPSSRLIVFSGTAAQVADTFHTPMHRFRVHGVLHLANAQAPQIPAALAGVVQGIVSLHDFRRTPAISAPRSLAARAEWNLYGSHYLYPADLAVIYDLNPLYQAGTSGAGVSIAIAGRSNIDLADVASFRAAAGLKANNPAVILEAGNPGLVAGDRDEATLDAEWAGALAPAASIKLVAAQSTATTDGIDLAAAYIVSHAVAPVLSVSYGNCESSMGATELAFYNALWQQAASQGISVFVSSGDSGAAGCSLGVAAKGTEAGVNGLCSSPYATCVGGTEFNEGAKEALYWAQTNGAGQGSALGYIPETVWNESGSNNGYGLWASGGGASGTFAQPAWQKAVSGAAAANGMRGVPDVALTAASHDGYIVDENGTDWIVSGTSAATPAFAAIMSLVVQSNSGKGQGSANPALYRLASSTTGVFHPTPSGNNTVPGVEGFTASGATYNLATGLGSVDAARLVAGWKPPAPPTLSLNVDSQPISIARGGAGTFRLGVATGGSFTGAVTLGVDGLPPGVTATWAVNPIEATAGKATLTLKAASTGWTGTAAIAFIAKGDGLTARCGLQVQIQRSPIVIGTHPPIN
jgi:subtilase family serine protease